MACVPCLPTPDDFISCDHCTFLSPKEREEARFSLILTVYAISGLIATGWFCFRCGAVVRGIAENRRGRSGSHDEGDGDVELQQIHVGP